LIGSDAEAALTEAFVRPLTLTERTVQAGLEALSGGRRGLQSLLPFTGPAVIASVAYMDPGNFATNIQAGAKYNYDLLWVVVLASSIAMLFQALSAKLGIAAGRNLAELSRDHFPRPVCWGMWMASEIAAMATDLAEFLGCSIGLSLLIGMPLLAGMAITGVATFGILTLQRRGFRPIELLIGGLVALIGASYVGELLIMPPDWAAVAFHSVVPRLDGADALTLAVGILGATVMPHAVYLHSGLTQDRIVPRNDEERRKLIRFSNREVMLALGLAGLVNMAMVAMSAAVFHNGVHDDIASIETAYMTLIPLMGAGAAAVFLTSLIASGLSSSAVGTMAGQIIMQGFVGFHIPLWVRRLVTMLPSFVVVALGVDATQALVHSQVVLSLVLPVPLIALLVLTRRQDVMGGCANGPYTSAAAAAAAGVVVALNGLLLLEAFGVPWASGSSLFAGLSAAVAFAAPKLLAPAVAIVALLVAIRALAAGWSGIGGIGTRWIFFPGGVARRLEEHERLVRELQRAKEVIERAEAYKSRALAAAGHDLKQPLQSIVMCLEIMSDRLPDPRDRDRAAHTLRAAEGLGRALDRLLAASRVKGGTIEQLTQTAAVSVLLSDAAEMFRPIAEMKGLELRVVPSRIRIRTDPDLLGEILQNFITNAIKYTRSGRVLIGCRRRGRLVSIEVHDTGVGIPRHQIDAAFVEYHRLSPENEAGLGLGLSIVRHLSDLLGHRVFVRSEPGRGSCFAVEVPACHDRRGVD
jgi:manganese transport protein